MTHPEHTRIVTELLLRPSSAKARRDPNRPILASLLAGRACGKGVLPTTLGLAAGEMDALWRAYFIGPPLSLPDQPGETLPEGADLIALLLEARAGCFASETWLARIVVAACAGREHLWRDLGLRDRGELSTLLYNAFPDLARQNVGDMKWKKFLYRVYCAREGIYVCPAPSCGVCSDHANCFAPEL
ncbi:MAG: nitrogen fixation protein NifQ [Zoogloeaceae bacterium]|jgi:nitrogen fixation protein NifQ|nr:nitrogen fixation protein NifQ [Zoogloeaceae bacterium]